MARLAKALRRATGVPILAGAAMALLLGACGKENQYVAPPPPKVIVQFPLQQTVTPYLEATGNVASRTTSSWSRVWKATSRKSSTRTATS